MTRLLDGDLLAALPEGTDPARALIDTPQMVTAAHSAFLIAGAEVIRMATATVTRRRMIRTGDGERFAEAILGAITAAEAARDAINPAALLAGTLGPFRASGFRDEVPGIEHLEPEYAEGAALLAPAADVFLCEGMSTVREAVAAARAASFTGRPVWVALAIHPRDPSRLTRGEPVGAAVAALRGLATAILASGPAGAVSAALPALAASGLQTGALVDGAEDSVAPWDPGKRAEDTIVRRVHSPEAVAVAAAALTGHGASLLGGALGAGPEAIASLGAIIRERR